MPVVQVHAGSTIAGIPHANQLNQMLPESGFIRLFPYCCRKWGNLTKLLLLITHPRPSGIWRRKSGFRCGATISPESDNLFTGWSYSLALVCWRLAPCAGRVNTVAKTTIGRRAKGCFINLLLLMSVGPAPSFPRGRRVPWLSRAFFSEIVRLGGVGLEVVEFPGLAGADEFEIALANGVGAVEVPVEFLVGIAFSAFENRQEGFATHRVWLPLIFLGYWAPVMSRKVAETSMM